MQWIIQTGEKSTGTQRGMLTPTLSVEEIKVRIIRREIVLPAGLKQTMRALLQHPDLVAFGTAKSVAASCSVSTSSVHRLARQCGYEDFAGMCSAFRNHLVQRSQGSKKFGEFCSAR
jgi:DNA-binding MurR/RpiR family transcriptional regulator